MVNSKNNDESVLVIDLVDDPIGPSARRMESRQLALQPTANSMWILYERRQHEFDDGSCGLLRQFLKLSLDWPRDPKLELGFRCRHLR